MAEEIDKKADSANVAKPTDEQVQELVGTVLEKLDKKFGLEKTVDAGLKRADAELLRQEAEVERQKGYQGQMEALKTLVAALQGMEGAIINLGNAMSKVARDVDIIKRVVGKAAKEGRLADALKASEEAEGHEAPGKKGEHRA